MGKSDLVRLIKGVHRSFEKIAFIVRINVRLMIDEILMFCMYESSRLNGCSVGACLTFVAGLEVLDFSWLAVNALMAGACSSCQISLSFFFMVEAFGL